MRQDFRGMEQPQKICSVRKQKIGWNVKSGLHADKISRFEDFRIFLMEPLAHGRPVFVENVEWGGDWSERKDYQNQKGLRE